MRKPVLTGLGVAAAAIAGLYLWNASWLAPAPDSGPYYVAHRGVHHTYPAKRVTDAQACTAVLIDPPRHGLFENTLPSMAAAFDAGAAIVELDIHPTTDGAFAVFHDWTVDCRTEGTGVTRERSMDYLRTLDVGHGYSADDGRTFPLRGTGVGMIPSLAEVLEAFPSQRLLINFKSNDPNEADLLSAYLAAHGADLSLLMVYGGDRPTARFLELHPDVRGFSRRTIMDCATRYFALGWSGHVPAACRNTILALPRNYMRLLWGWPRRLEQRMAAADTLVIVAGDHDGRSAFSGIDTREAHDRLPRDYSGGIWTNRIELLGPGAD